MVLCEYMWDIIFQLNLSRRTYETAYRLTGGAGIVVHFAVYDAS